jgi:hypothetical protein
VTVSRVKHIAYVVNDLEESADFFEKDASGRTAQRVQIS